MLSLQCCQKEHGGEQAGMALKNAQQTAASLGFPGGGKQQGHLQKKHPHEGKKLVSVHSELHWVPLGPPWKYNCWGKRDLEQKLSPHLANA